MNKKQIADANESPQSEAVRSARKPGRVRGGVEDLMKLAECLRENGWDDTGSRLLRCRLARTGGKNG